MRPSFSALDFKSAALVEHADDNSQIIPPIATELRFICYPNFEGILPQPSRESKISCGRFLTFHGSPEQFQRPRHRRMAVVLHPKLLALQDGATCSAAFKTFGMKLPTPSCL